MALNTDEIVKLAPVSVLTLQPGDTIVLTTPGWISDEDAVRLRELMHSKFPNHQVLILGNGLTIGVMRPVSRVARLAAFFRRPSTS